MVTNELRRDSVADRYGRPRSPRRIAWAWSIGAGVAAIAVGGWFLWANPVGWGPSAVAKNTGFSMQDDAVTVTFDRTVTAGRTSACAIQALDKGFSTVGWKVVTFPVSDGKTSQEKVTLRVIGEATTGLVEACWLT